MLEAVVFICLMAREPQPAPECGVDRAVWIGPVPGKYADAEACQQASLMWLHGVDFGAVLQEGKDYQITITCKDHGV